MVNKKLAPHPEVTLTEFEDEGVLLHLETKTYYSLNKPGLYVWGLIKDGNLPAEIVDRVRVEFSVEKEIAEENVSNIVDDLIKERLVEVVD
jgi:hypothetical protein